MAFNDAAYQSAVQILAQQIIEMAKEDVTDAADKEELEALVDDYRADAHYDVEQAIKDCLKAR